jgi:TolB-like protein/class 3 adenylate cyclase/Tfp pilus assembly protein PilF
MPAEVKANAELELGHVLFMDIVGFSKLLVDEQTEATDRLTEIVLNCNQVQRAEAADKLVRLPTGDGMALVFFTNPEAPVQCAEEISKALKDLPHQIPLRIGIHTGPVNKVVDVNRRINVTGAGINTAQRVMDCADAGHILISKRVADDLAHNTRWRAHLHDLGEVEVKHGAKIDIVNLYTDSIGNPQLPGVIKRETQRRAAAVSRKRRNLLLVTGLSVTIAAVAAFVLFEREAARRLEKSIAVLPFESLSDDKENAYFADGVQDEILTNLAKVAALKVISRRSAAQYRGSTKAIREIGQALGVAYVVEGSVRKAADKIHVTAQLIDTRNETQTWAEKFDRELPDVFAIQSEIAQSIVTRLKAALSPAEKASIEQRPTQDLEAYDLYLRAKELMYATDLMTDPKGEEKYQTAADLLNKAVARDPKFALAYCLLADANVNLYRESDSTSYLAAAEAAVNVAVRLAPDAGETRLAHAFFFYFGHFDFDHALEQLELAAQSLPNSVDVAWVSARVERRLGRWTESARHFVRASELDPRDSRIRSQVAYTFGMMRRYDEAMRAADRAIADFPERADIFRQQKAGLAVDKGDLKLARATLDQISAAESKTVMTMLPRFNIAMLLRDFDEADRAVAARAQFPHHEFLAPDVYFAALVAEARGDKDKARPLFLQAKQELETRLREYPKHESAGYWLGDLAEVDAALGHKEEALRAIDEALKTQLGNDPLQRPGFLSERAIVYCRLGEPEPALQQIEELAKVPNGATYGDLRFNPVWRPLRGNPRFEKIVASLKPK